MLKKITSSALLHAREREEERETRQEELDDYAFELELFETHELPVFMLEMGLEGMTPEDTLGAIHDKINGHTGNRWCRGYTIMELARFLYGWHSKKGVKDFLLSVGSDTEGCDTY